MGFKINTDSALRNLIKEKSLEIYKRAAVGIQNTEYFKIFHSSLVSYISSRDIKEFKVILMSKNDMSLLSDGYYEKLCQVLDSDNTVFNSHVILNGSLDIVSSYNESSPKNSGDARKIYLEISKSYITFVIHPGKNLSFFIDGDEFGEAIFYTNDELLSYQKMVDVSEMPSLFDEYRKHLMLRNNYNKFFIPKSHLESLRVDLKSSLDNEKFVDSHKHLLNNKPEDLFREDLRHFLQSKLRAKFLSREVILENFKRLDIFLIDESGSGLYLIEVKWVGTSISKCGKKIGTSYDESDIYPDAIKQTVNYINQLHFEDKNIKIGYLAVFDARLEAIDDTKTDLKSLSLEESAVAKFRRLPNFRVYNQHPK